MSNVVETDLILGKDSPFLMQEAYKNLRTNLHFSLPSDKCHVIGITSSNRNEGKTTTAINLAISFAQLGKNVILIDCDLRIPTIAKKLNLPATPGLSDLLIGDNTLSECLKKDDTHKMYVIPSGHIPMEPTFLLQSEKMADLIEGLKKRFDYIFIDTPPVGMVSDAQALSNLMDGYLAVVRNNVTTKKEIGATVEALKFVNSNILGFVSTSASLNSIAYGKGKRNKYYEYANDKKSGSTKK